ncbi:MAG: VWA domain-containing protein [Lachnospiraceae bacterium]|nr:VWA domain-containing protein [Lachnospiraceae bacterium]
MKKKNIAVLIIGTIIMTSSIGCRLLIPFANGNAAAAQPSYTETETTGDMSYENKSAYTEEASYDYESAYSAEEAYTAEDVYDAFYEEPYAAYGYSYGDTEAFCPGYYWPVPDPNSGEKYKEIKENAFTDVVSSPLSTFGADIDTASYANLRRMINDGYTARDIPEGAIRTEELVNYFGYDYKKPDNGDTFAVNSSIIDCPWNRKTKLVNIGIKAKDVVNIEDVPSNIVFLIDVSGSMEDYDKLPLLQMGLNMLVDDLDENDRVSIVTYASSSDVVIAGVPGDDHPKIKRAINSLLASGSTNGGEGILTAYKLAEKYFIKDGNNRVIMATDGDLNVGITSEDELEKLISDKKEGGVFLSVLGFGTGNYNDSALETLADKGNGNYSYIDSLPEAKKVLVDEFNSTLFTVAKDVKFQVEFNPRYVSEYRLIGYENRQMAARDFNDDTKDGGEVGSGHSITVMYEIKLTDSEADENEDIELRYQDKDLSETGRESDEWMMLSVRYKDPDEDRSELLSFPISKESYTKAPDCDTLFAAYVAECGMILNNSEYIGALELDDVYRQLSELELNDEYKEEFLQLIRQL